jgi:uncharacterized Zn-binding protein involved in type VI secretion
MGRAIIRQGDPTSHGGRVIGGSLVDLFDGKPVAFVGHKVSCPKCRGIHEIIEGAPTMTFYGKGVALEGMKTSCGATLIATQFTSTVEYASGGGGGAYSRAAMSSNALSSDANKSTGNSAVSDAGDVAESDVGDESPRSVRFQAVDPVSGKPLSKRPYIFTRENGVQHGGLTDAQGYTEIIETEAPEQVAVHFMFADPDGQTIDREDLLP